jgi:hypothetical protein
MLAVTATAKDQGRVWRSAPKFVTRRKNSTLNKPRICRRMRQSVVVAQCSPGCALEVVQADEAYR